MISPLTPGSPAWKAAQREPTLRHPLPSKPAVQRASDVPIPARRSPLDASVGPKATETAETGVWRFTVPGIPLGKPRMTQRDKWAKRPCVMRYRAWADALRAGAPTDLPKAPLVVNFVAYLPIPKSYSAKKREAVRGQFHREKPDLDNLCKSWDALFEQDKSIAKSTAEKRYDDGQGPRIKIEVRLIP